MRPKPMNSICFMMSFFGFTAPFGVRAPNHNRARVAYHGLSIRRSEGPRLGDRRSVAPGLAGEPLHALCQVATIAFACGFRQWLGVRYGPLAGAVPA